MFVDVQGYDPDGSVISCHHTRLILERSRAGDIWHYNAKVCYDSGYYSIPITEDEYERLRFILQVEGEGADLGPQATDAIKSSLEACRRFGF